MAGGGYGGRQAVTGNLSFGPETEVTIASGSITRTRTSHTVGAETGTTDNLDLIAGGLDGQLIYIRPVVGDDITVRHNQNAANANNILLATDTDFAMSEDDNILVLQYDDGLDTNGAWLEVSRDELGAAALIATHAAISGAHHTAATSRAPVFAQVFGKRG